MNTPTVRTRFALVLAQLVFALFAATSSALACIVGTGTSASCTEAALNACLPGGGGFDGTVTFAQRRLPSPARRSLAPTPPLTVGAWLPSAAAERLWCS